MGDVDINWFAVILAALSSVGVSWLWYSKYLFRDRWRRFAGLTLDREEKGLIPALVVAGVAGLFTAYVVAYVGSLIEANSGDGDMQSALGAAFWLWVGVAATTVIVSDTFAQRPIQMMAISLGNRLVTLLVMGLIIGVFGV
ncbi:MAG: DUF1761 domain-containing protein [Thermomicrobiales bacterium]|jgi:hypothetical protein